MSGPSVPPPPPSYQPQPQAQPAGPLSESDDRLWGSLAHFGNILGFLPALLIFLILKDRGATVAREAKVALNWIIGVSIVQLVLYVLAVFLNVAGSTSTGAAIVFGLLSGLIGLVIFATVIINVVFAIINGVRVNQGGFGKYPFSRTFIR